MFASISQSIYPSSFTVARFGQLHAELLPGRAGYVIGPMLGTFVLYFGWDFLFQTGEFQLLIFSTVLIMLMLVLPNGLLSLRAAARGRAEAWRTSSKSPDSTKRFGGLVAVNDVSFSVREHEILSVIGPNGAGKSTLFKLIASFLRPTGGEVRFKGERISGLAPHIAARKGVVRTFQETTIFKSMTVRDNVITAHHLRSKRKPCRLLFRHRGGAPATRKTFGRSADEILAFPGARRLAGRDRQQPAARASAGARHRHRPGDRPGGPAPR